MSETPAYVRLLTVFEDLGVNSERELEALLRESPESASYDDDHIRITREGRLASNLCERFAELPSVDSFYGPAGIHQFSISSASRLDDEDLIKGMFLSRVTTVFTPHRLTYKYKQEHPEWLGWDYDLHSADWEVSHDFVRDLYRHRKLIERSDLVLLPTGWRYSTTNLTPESGYTQTTTKTKENLEILEALDKVKVIDIGLASDLLDRLIARYRAKHQLVRLPELHVPWIEHVDLDTVLKIRDDSHDELADFQCAYHAALLEYIDHHRSANFAGISRAIAEDIIDPALRRMEKKHQRTLALHRSMRAVGAAIAALPLGAAAVSGALFDELSVGELTQTIPPSIAGVFGAITTNAIYERHAAKALEDERFYVLWDLAGDRCRPAQRWRGVRRWRLRTR